MTPYYQIKADDQDITDRIRDRLISLRITDEAGWQSDTVELTLDDRDRRMALPRHGVQLTVFMGYEGDGLVRMGLFTVDEVLFSGMPDTITIRGRAANFRNTLKEQKTRPWEQITIGDLVKTIAREHELEPVTSDQLKDKLLDHIDQTEESDLHFLSRLAKDHDAISKPIENRLLFVPRGEARSASSKPMPIIPLNRSALSSYNFTIADRGKYEAAIAHWHDATTGKTSPVRVGPADARPVYTLKGLHPDAEAAQAAAKAKLQALKRGQATGNLTLPGRLNITAETRLSLSGIKDRINGDWIVTRAEHELSSQGMVTRLSIETPKA